VLKEAILDAEGKIATAEVAIKYGNFLQMILDFLVIAFCVFCFVRVINKIREKASEEEREAAAAAKAKADAEAKEKADAAAAASAAAQKKIDEERAEELALLREIRDSLKK